MLEKDDKIIAEFLGMHINNDWDGLMYVIGEIEKVDLSEYHYTGESMGETENNFQRISFTLCDGGSYSGIELTLDPPMTIASNFNKENTWKENVYQTIVETINHINTVKNESKAPEES